MIAVAFCHLHLHPPSRMHLPCLFLGGRLILQQNEWERGTRRREDGKRRWQEGGRKGGESAEEDARGIDLNRTSLTRDGSQDFGFSCMCIFVFLLVCEGAVAHLAYGRMAASSAAHCKSSTLLSWCMFECGGILHQRWASRAWLLVPPRLHIPDPGRAVASAASLPGQTMEETRPRHQSHLHCFCIALSLLLYCYCKCFFGILLRSCKPT